MRRTAAPSVDESARRAILSAGTVLRLAVWFGLLSGALNLGLRGAQLLLGQRIHLSLQFLWMAPLADVALFSVAAALLCLAGAAWSRFRSAPVVLFVFVLLLVAGPLIFVPRLRIAARVLFALGIAVQGSRLLRSRLPLVLPVARRTSILLAGAFLLVAAATNLYRAAGERLFFERLPQARAGAPNVLLIILDTVRASSLSLYGYDRATTPNLSAFAAEGVTFERAIATAPWTLPSHASMFTGRFPHELSADWLTPLGDRYPTLAEWLAGRGYATAGFVANLLYATREDGLARGFGTYEDYPVSPAMVMKSSFLARFTSHTIRRIAGARDHLVRIPAGAITDRFLRWLERRDEEPSDRPFFVFLNYFDAHLPFVPPPPFDLEFGARRFERELPERGPWPREALQIQIDGYDGSLAYIDHEMGRLFGELERRGLLENTLVVVTSDHGELLGEHELLSHGNSLYRPLIHVPLVFRFDGELPPERRIRAVVTLADLPATIAELVAGDSDAPFPGRSLSVHWSAHAGSTGTSRPVLSAVSRMVNRPEYLPAARADMRSIIDGGLHLIQSATGEEELYDFDNDPEEQNNLLTSPDREDDYLELRALLEAATSLPGTAARGAWPGHGRRVSQRGSESRAPPGSRVP